MVNIVSIVGDKSLAKNMEAVSFQFSLARSGSGARAAERLGCQTFNSLLRDQSKCSRVDCIYERKLLSILSCEISYTSIPTCPDSRRAFQFSLARSGGYVTVYDPYLGINFQFSLARSDPL